MKGRVFLIKAGAVAEAALTSFVEGFCKKKGEQLADGKHAHNNVELVVLSQMPAQIPPQYWVMWQDWNGVWWYANPAGRWYWGVWMGRWTWIPG